jgi:hypothetical protein
MKRTVNRPCSAPEAAARKLIEIANSVEVVQDGRIHIELINGRCCLSTRPRRPNTSRGSIWRSSALAGNARERDLREVHPGQRG